MNIYIEKYIDYLRIQRNYSNNTEINYIIDLEDYETYINKKKIKFDEITYKEISIYTKYLKDEKNLESSSINRHLSSLRSFYNFLLNKEDRKSTRLNSSHMA